MLESAALYAFKNKFSIVKVNVPDIFDNSYAQKAKAVVRSNVFNIKDVKFNTTVK